MKTKKEENGSEENVENVENTEPGNGKKMNN
jgi:hypothetical protein